MLTLKNKISFLPILFCFCILLFASSCKSGKDLSKTENKNSGTEVTSKKTTKKYAELLGVQEKEIDNTKLYAFIDEWYGVPYKYGGKNKSGIDCSNFSAQLYSNIYHRSIQGSSSGIFDQCKTVSKDNLKEGDLVFFKIEKESISHVGVYLQNNKFVHATTKKGVMINDLDEAYYKKYYYKGGRLKD